MWTVTENCRSFIRLVMEWSPHGDALILPYLNCFQTDSASTRGNFNLCIIHHVHETGIRFVTMLIGFSSPAILMFCMRNPHKLKPLSEGICSAGMQLVYQYSLITLLRVHFLQSTYHTRSNLNISTSRPHGSILPPSWANWYPLGMYDSL